MAPRTSMAVALLCSAICAPVAAQGLEPILWLQPSPAGVLQRVLGQLADLPSGLTPVSMPGPAEGTWEPGAVEALARARGARAVLWVEPAADGGLQLHVYEVGRGLRPVRHFAAADATHGESAALEALALAVRSLLRTLPAADAPAGPRPQGERRRPASPPPPPVSTPRPDTEAAPAVAASDGLSPPPSPPSPPQGPPIVAAKPPPAPAAEAMPPPAAVAAPVASDGSGSGMHAAVSMGWELRGDGQGPAHGPTLGLSLGRGVLSGQLRYSGSLDTRADLDDVVLGLRSDRWAAGVVVRLWRSRWQRLEAGAAGGLLLLHRRTAATGPQLQSTASATTPAATAELGAGLGQGLVRWPGGGLELTAGVGIMFLVTPITLRATTQRGSTEASLRNVQPMGSLALTWRHE